MLKAVKGLEASSRGISPTEWRILKDWNWVAILHSKLVKFAKVHDWAEVAISFGNYEKREVARKDRGSTYVLFEHVSNEPIYDLALTVRHPADKHIRWTCVCLKWDGSPGTAKMFLNSVISVVKSFRVSGKAAG